MDSEDRRGLTHTAQPALLDLADRSDLHETARGWQHRVDIHSAETGHRRTRAAKAPSGRFGTPMKTTVPVIDWTI